MDVRNRSSLIITDWDLDQKIGGLRGLRGFEEKKMKRVDQEVEG